MVLPTQGGLDQLKYRTKEAQEFVSVIDNTYPQYEEDQTIGTMLRKIKHAIRVAGDKIEAVEETIRRTNQRLRLANKNRRPQNSLPNATNPERMQLDDMELNLNLAYKMTPEASSNTGDCKTMENEI